MRRRPQISYLYLSSEQTKTRIHGDQVLAQPLGADRKASPREARIVRVPVPKTSQIVGRYFTDAGVGFRCRTTAA